MQEQSKNTDYPKKADGSPNWRKFKDGDHGKVWDARRKAYKEFEEEQKKTRQKMKAIKRIYPKAKSFIIKQSWTFGIGWADVAKALDYTTLVGLAEQGATKVSLEIDGKFNSDFSIKELL